MAKIKSYWEATGIRRSDWDFYFGLSITVLVWVIAMLLLNPHPFASDRWIEYCSTFKYIVTVTIIAAIPSTALAQWNWRRFEKNDAAYEQYLSHFPVNELIRIITEHEFEGDYGTRGRIADYLQSKRYAKLLDKPGGGRVMVKLKDRTNTAEAS